MNRAQKSAKIENIYKIRNNYKIYSSTIFCRIKNYLNFQVVDLRVLPEEIRPMITKALLLPESWSGGGNLKYAMVEELRSGQEAFYNWENYTLRLGSTRLGFQK